MANRWLLYYITDRNAFPGDEISRRRRLLEKIGEAARAGVDYIQLREKDLSARELESLAREAVGVIREARQLPSDPQFVVVPSLRKPRRVGHPLPETPLIGVSCHSPADVERAAANGATFAVFAPVFEKKDVPDAQPAGLVQLAEACRAEIPVLALGGITAENARSCFKAGACGIAAIRLFQENDVATVVRVLREMGG
jgi:thiamine-phosphate pyrophosphorylase